MKIKAIIIDLDGTLRDTRDIIYNAYQQAINAHTGRDASREEIKPHVHHQTAVHKALVPDIDAEEFIATYMSFVHPEVDVAELYPDANEVLCALRAAGYRLAVATSASQKGCEDYLSGAGIANQFDVVVGMSSGLNPKPAPDLILRALEQLDCQPDEVIMVGDMPADVQASHATGVQCIGIEHGFSSGSELEGAGADYIIDSLAELPSVIEKIG